MSRFLTAFFVSSVSFALASVATAQVPVYRSLGATGLEPAYRNWNSTRQAISARVLDPRPQLPGLRSRSVEILTDAMLRKHPQLLKYDAARARELILRRYSSNLGQLRGIMAEAMFIDRNPEWEYVRSPNATQHDVSRPGPGKAGQGPVRWNGQIKFHVGGSPTDYAADMVKDNRAHRFFVPDDHVDPLKSHLKAKAEAAQGAGDTRRAKGYWRDYGRVRPIGATSIEIDQETRKAARLITSEKYATYTSLSAALALALVPTAWDWASGESSAEVVAYRVGKTTSMIVVGVATDAVLARVADGNLRGTIRGNVITGVVLAVAETGWLLHEYGWREAFYRPEFYKQLAGGVSGLMLGIAGFAGGTTLASETGPWAPVIGTGVGIVTGAVGNFGGHTATHWVLETFWPDLLRQHEQQRIAAVKSGLERRVAELQAK